VTTAVDVDFLDVDRPLSISEAFLATYRTY